MNLTPSSPSKVIKVLRKILGSSYGIGTILISILLLAVLFLQIPEFSFKIEILNNTDQSHSRLGTNENNSNGNREHIPRESGNSVESLTDSEPFPLVNFTSDHNWPRIFCNEKIGSPAWTALSSKLLSEFELTTILENIHFHLKNGEERRVQRLQEEEGRLEYRFFSLDAEGLPEPWPTQIPSSTETPETLLEEWRTLSSEVKTLQTKEGSSKNLSAQLHLEYENEIITKLEYLGPRLAIVCDSQGCHCPPY